MPIYEYRCSACGFDKEYLQKLSDAPITVCERCGQSTMTKLMSAAGFQLKGSGWYATDFKNNGSKPKSNDGGNEATSKDGSSKDASSKDSASAEPAAAPAASAASTAETKSSTESTAPAAPATQPAP